MPSANDGLGNARLNKKDEFYTMLTDIEKELRHYRKHFKGKTVLCNCDDPFESNFFAYFALNFNRLGLKKLIATCYAGSSIAGTQLSFDDVIGPGNDGKAYKAVVTQVYDADGNGEVNMLDVAELLKTGENELAELEGNGDFRSKECLDLLDEADIVVTNPPFSLFKEYVPTLIDHGKKFIIIGNQNAITYKEIFPLFKENKMWIGYGFSRNCAHFYSPYEDTATDLDHREGLIRVSGVMWFTNLEIKKHNEEYICVKRYAGHEENYPRYENYDAIEVSLAKNIPLDYTGIMGVPITFMDKHCPDQFDIVWTTDRGGDGHLDDIKLPHTRFDAPVVNGKGVYKRVFIRYTQSWIDSHPDDFSGGKA